MPAGVSLCFGAALYALAIFAPERFKLLLQEDGPVEWITVWSFVGAAVLFARAGWSEARWGRVAPLALASFCVFVAGEEISWGQRILGYQPPEMFLRDNAQLESNFHNLLKGLFDSRWQVLLVAVGYGVVAPLLRWRKRLPEGWAPAWPVMPAMIAVAVLELSYPLELAGELAEALLGLAFLHDAAARVSGHGVAAAALGVSVVVGGITPMAMDAARGGDEVMEARARAELTTWRERCEQGRCTGLFGAKRIHKRVFSAIEAGYVTGDATDGDSDDDLRQRYALDPWQQPYWILFVPTTRDRGEVMVYSFGPNRRRDTLLETMPSDMAGDDIGVGLPLAR